MVAVVAIALEGDSGVVVEVREGNGVSGSDEWKWRLR